MFPRLDPGQGRATGDAIASFGEAVFRPYQINVMFYR